MAPNPAPKVCPDTKGMVFTHYCITIAIFSENALSSKNAFQVKKKLAHISNVKFSRWTPIFLSDPGIPGVQSMGPECLSQTDLFET